MYCTYRCTHKRGEDINVTNLMSVFEIIGSIAFAISGSMLAIKKEMDLFGILILGIVTSVGAVPSATSSLATHRLPCFKIRNVQ